ncbi:alpha/beta fold hydrolase [Kineococcus radiotolerans]|uniref:Alpha/beta hydrolase fold n=1 Tax=Kineococcus radiotolerans (strain ATCC BAA-149 / DSM 14245 / SRS30216) TaxID=266940 RepID=A6WDX1_KINRD|nr:alpha/beta fold hydrolase [Kineococcus radiotolerans]ABS05010.1 alpha/beta hydrolase fold [Kineococcus radiotolerans SRS30216 = ATCC BAA-149]
MDGFSRDGLRFATSDSGDPDGDVVVCLHGFPQGPEAYDAVVPRLTAGGLRVLVPEQRGYCPTARPPRRGDYALAELVADVVALVDAAGAGRVHLVGHDWGGVVAWTVAARHPTRVASLTALSQAHPAAFRAAVTTSSQALRSTYVAFFQLPGVPERVLLAGGGAVLARSLRRTGLPADLAAGYARRHAQPGSLRAALNWYRALPRAGTVGPVEVPVTYLHGLADPFYSRAAVAGTAAQVRGPYREVALPTGHWIPELAPRAVADAVLAAAGVRG